MTALVRHREGRWYSFNDYSGFEMTEAVSTYLPITIDDVPVPVLAPRSARVSHVKVGEPGLAGVLLIATGTAVPVIVFSAAVVCVVASGLLICRLEPQNR